LRLACEGLAEDADDPDLLAVATEAAWRLDFLPEAMSHATNWLRVARTMRERIDATRYIARLHQELGEHQRSGALVAEMITLAESLPTGADKARAQAAVAQLKMLRDEDGAIEWAEKAIAEAELAGDKGVQVQARIEWASSQKNHVGRWLALTALREAAT